MRINDAGSQDSIAIVADYAYIDGDKINVLNKILKNGFDFP
jgi:hypothetical protein